MIPALMNADVVNKIKKDKDKKSKMTLVLPRPYIQFPNSKIKLIKGPTTKGYLSMKSTYYDL